MSRTTAIVAGALLVMAAFPPGRASGDDRSEIPPIRVKHVGPGLADGDVVLDESSPIAPRVAARPAPRTIGSRHRWLAYDEHRGAYLKPYRLRGKGRHIEVWVATGRDETSTRLAFPDGDCRNDERVTITDRQVRRLVRAFGRNIYPKESRVFSRPPDRNGSNASLPQAAGLPDDYYRGQGDNIVVLVDNIRDENFYDTDNSRNLPYIAGFFSSAFTELHDRNVMSIDAFDWIHRSGANPPNEPVAGDVCRNRSARPFLYEATFAHEYQHLLEYYEDPNETTWMNEGLSDWAQTLTGYADTDAPITEIDFNGHIQCFLGHLGTPTPANPLPREGGPENSLNLWRDQGSDEILCDYGAVYTMMEYLRDTFGRPFMTRLHRANSNGFASLGNTMRRFETGTTVRGAIHEWIAAVALDGVLDDGAAFDNDRAAYQVSTLDATIDWDNPHSFSSPGAPPNGGDFVRLRGSDGTYLGASEIASIEFDGADQLAPDVPVEGFTVLLVAYTDDRSKAFLAEIPLGPGFTGKLEGQSLTDAIGTEAETVGAIVMFDESTEAISRYAPYGLTVDGVLQPGGS